MYEPEQLRAVVEDLGITATSKVGARKQPADPNWKPAHSWTVTLKKPGAKPLTVDFFGGAAVTHVDAAGVLSGLAMDTRVGEQSFEDYCSEFGIDEDSRQAERTWKACRAMAPKVRAFLGDNFDRVVNAEH